jgi:hypothetical protein
MEEMTDERRRMLGDMRLNTTFAMSKLAESLTKQDKLKEAASVMKVVLNKRKRILGEEHIYTILVMSKLKKQHR